MFNDAFCLTQAVLNGTKTMTRRAVTRSLLDEYDAWYEDFIYKPIGEEDYLSTDEYVLKRTTHKVGDIVAIAQPYKDIIERLPMYSDAILDEVGMPRKAFRAGWTNKMFVKANLLPHHIRLQMLRWNAYRIYQMMIYCVREFGNFMTTRTCFMFPKI